MFRVPEGLRCTLRPLSTLKPIQLVQSAGLLQLKPIFETLAPDEYLQKMLKEQQPSRYRLFRRVNINLETGDIRLTQDQTLEQNVDDFRKNARVFELLPDQHFHNDQFLTLLRQATSYTQFYDNNRHVDTLDCNVHFVRQIARPNATATNSPEGRHQDGAQFIVSAFVVRLENVDGAVSRIGTRDGFNYLEHQLQPGQGLLHDDQDYWHDVTQIKPLDPNQAAIRDIIGFDFNFQRGNIVDPAV